MRYNGVTGCSSRKEVEKLSSAAALPLVIHSYILTFQLKGKGAFLYLTICTRHELRSRNVVDEIMICLWVLRAIYMESELRNRPSISFREVK